jgi:hypothetical protein
LALYTKAIFLYATTIGKPWTHYSKCNKANHKKKNDV